MRILAINPGSTTTKLALFEDETALLSVEIAHPKDALLAVPRVAEQQELRAQAVREALALYPAACGRVDAVVGRGGLLAPIPGGTYAITEPMLEVLASARHGEHACNLGAPLALEFAAEYGCPAFIVDPPVTDEMEPVARLTGLPGITRRSVFHALSQRGAAREAARRHGLTYGENNFIVAHLGGGISIGAHRRGKVVDVINALDGEGPFSPERAGHVPILRVLPMLERGELDPEGLRTLLLTRGGLFAHLGTNDLREVEARIAAGDEAARLVFDALAYNIAKDAASFAPVFAGPDGLDLAAVVVTGGMARSPRMADALVSALSFLAPVEIVTGLEEMHALAQGALLALRGEVPMRSYAEETE
ncbi:butyrate kinase [Desulfovibrio sp. X2]|uniref:butyrate kinase n=1 Tax=Desulfovibrio sp. X2 TaxID=941449 RepID=UPI000358EE67|nr:butyrate kinase [Desulfovibrio sp. X2]EPR43361.1 butyrate kinase [Desulfovibrio sp. X2]